jgi:hypothetical protein
VPCLSRKVALTHAACVALFAMSGCTPLTHETRAARSSLGCMKAVLARHDFTRLDDDVAHCLAAGLIARHCSVSEAYLASIGKEVRDTFGSGDAQWKDVSADRRGIDCARQASADKDVEACCRTPP